MPAKSKGIAMLAKTYKDKAFTYSAFEPKIDGIRVIIKADLDLQTVSFRTRNDIELKSLQHLADDILKLCSGLTGKVILDGEATSGTFFSGLGNLMQSKESAHDAKIWLFDIVTDGTYSDRRERLVNLFDSFNSDKILLVKSLTNLEPEEAYYHYVSQGFEGVMIKDRTSYYAQGSRSSSWLKIKEADTYDCTIVSIKSGAGKCADMAGNIVVDFDGHKVSVGTGLSDKLRTDLLVNPDKFIGRTIEVGCQMLTPNGSLRHPTFIRFRDDK